MLNWVAGRFWLWAFCLSQCLAVFRLAAPAQERASAAALPSITFALDFPGSDPSHYVVSISSDGRATYESGGKADSETEPADPFRLEFAVSAARRDHIFDLAKKARYFEGQIDSGRKNLAMTGHKTLAYKDEKKNTQATYNYSPLPAVQELTDFFQRLSSTMEFGRRLEHQYRFQKLALSDELKHMEELANQNGLEEVSAISPILQRIAKDPAVMNVVRARAQRLLNRAGGSSAAR